MKLIPLDLLSIQGEIESGFYLISYKDICVPVRYQKGSGKSMVVDFHGAIDRNRFHIPKFQAIISNLYDSHQLRIADPTLELSETISIGWYLGGESMPLQKQLAELLNIFSMRLDISRCVYLGGSAGGFSALYYSWCNPGSVCIAVNPQVDLRIYSRFHIGQYLSAAWPAASSLDDIREHVVVDLPAIYGTDFKNTVIYLQSTGDMKHFERQFPRFCRVGFKNAEKFILQCSYWGVPNHGNSVPASAFVTWLKAAIVTPTLERQDILDTYHTLNASSSQERISGNETAKPSMQPVASEIVMANLLRDYQLRAAEGK